MNILLKIDDFQENVVFLESKKNNIMNGNFIKMLYSTEHFSMNGIFIDFPIVNFEKKVYNGKKILFFNTSENSDLISRISKIESTIIELFIKNECPQNKSLFNKKMVNTIHTQMINGMVKYYNYTNENDSNHFYIKISGIWETDLDIGLTYKIIQY
jgi:phosphatidate phosphatase APP1